VEPLASDDPVEIAGYQLRAQLGSGGMGRVYLAFTPAGRPVALKVVRPDLGNDAEFRSRFRQEVDASRRVHGMYTAQVLDADPDASPPWLVTAYVPGPSLQQAVAGHGPMPEQTVFVLLAGVAEALASIHAAGIVHRDLKPSNVLLAPDGPRVIDFGIARAADSTVLTGTGMIVGSPPFMAPEQVTGQAITSAVDVFALGALAVFAATGRSPFGDGIDMGILYRVTHEEPDLSACPPRLREVVGRCLAKDPAARPLPAEIIAAGRAQSAGQAGGMALPWLPPDVLTALAQHAPPPAPPSLTHTSTTPVVPPAAGGTAPPRRAARARPLVLGGAFGTIGVAALAVVGVLTLGGHHGDSPVATAPSVGAQKSNAVDSCLVGSWKDAGDTLDNTIEGQPGQFTGAGGGMKVDADGSVTEQFGPETLTATIDGNVWTEVLGGSATMHATTRDGDVVFSGVAASPDASYRLYENGAYNSTGPMSVSSTPTRYTCSPSTLRLYWSDGTSVYDREVA
jgi:hypothetical protein